LTTPRLDFEPLSEVAGELALGEAVNAVVLDDVEHVHAAPDGVGELAEADRG
jgi:hypothetical protein